MELHQPRTAALASATELGKAAAAEAPFDGKLNDLDMMMKKYDLDGNGSFSRAEVKAILSDLTREKDKSKDYKKIMICGALAGILAMCGVMLMAWAAVEMSKESHVDGSTVKDLNGKPVVSSGGYATINSAEGLSRRRRRLVRGQGRQLDGTSIASISCSDAVYGAQNGGMVGSVVHSQEVGDATRTEYYAGMVGKTEHGTSSLITTGAKVSDSNVSGVNFSSLTFNAECTGLLNSACASAASTCTISEHASGGRRRLQAFVDADGKQPHPSDTSAAILPGWLHTDLSRAKEASHPCAAYHCFENTVNDPHACHFPQKVTKETCLEIGSGGQCARPACAAWEVPAEKLVFHLSGQEGWIEKEIMEEVDLAERARQL